MSRHFKYLGALFTLMTCTLFADYGPPTTGGSDFFKGKPAPPKQQPGQQPGPHGLPPKPELPPMVKPFGMPGVIGFQDGRWMGTDFLGYLSDHIGITVEILKTDNVRLTVDTNTLENIAGQAFQKLNLTPSPDISEGPPLPFLHILVTIYPAEKDKYVVIGNSRLFEQLQVTRKDFVPAGFWQGITWENEDVVLSNGKELDGKVKYLVESLAKAFATRYRQYNYGKEGMPPVQSIPPLQQ